MKLGIDNIVHDGAKGKFRANPEQMGWQSLDGGRSRVLAATAVKRAEWFEGKLRVLSEEEDGSVEVLALENFSPEDYDALWRYFEQCCNVYVKKHKAVAALSEEDFDTAMLAIEDAADRVDEASAGSVQKKAKEADLMKQVEVVRDGLDQAVAGDKQALSRVFAANGCERIGRLRLVVDTVDLEVYRKDPRWLHLLGKAKTIESVLRDLGTFRQWRPPEDSSLARRQMVRELKRRQGEEDDADDGGAEAPARLNAAAFAAVEQLGHPIGGSWPPPPPPEPEPPAPAVDAVATPGPSFREESDDDGAEDEEVTNPNAVRADAIDERRPRGTQKASGLGGADERNLRKTYANSLLEGWVWKRSRILKRWRRRWLVLVPERLMSFKRRNDREATEIVEAGTCQRVYDADPEVSQKLCFCVVVARRSYYMVCDDQAQKQAWLTEIPKALGTTTR